MHLSALQQDAFGALLNRDFRWATVPESTNASSGEHYVTSASDISFCALCEHGITDRLLQFLIDNDKLEEQDVQRQRQQQQFMSVMQAVHAAIRSTTPD